MNICVEIFGDDSVWSSISSKVSSYLCLTLSASSPHGKSYDSESGCGVSEFSLCPGAVESRLELEPTAERGVFAGIILWTFANFVIFISLKFVYKKDYWKYIPLNRLSSEPLFLFKLQLQTMWWGYRQTRRLILWWVTLLSSRRSTVTQWKRDNKVPGQSTDQLGAVWGLYW